MNWFKQTLANVAGTQEPIYGPDAIQSVTAQAQTTPYRELTKDDLRWKAMQSTSVETQTFYLFSDNGDIAMLQVIYSNVVGIHTTCHFNSKLFATDGKTPHQWSTDSISNYMFDEDMLSFGGDNIALTLNAEGNAYTIKSAMNEDCLINVTLTRTAPGFAVGEDGTSTFGTDPQNPWGSMRHAFWPRCKVEGTIVTPEKEIDFKGRGLFIHALQGMKPHHAAARWNFANFQSPTYSAVFMEYTTPPSYGSTVVSVGGIAKDGEIVYAGPLKPAKHLESAADSHNDWPEPKSVKFTWDGKTKDDKPVEGVLEGSLGQRLDRVDVMAEVPGFIKSIVGSVAGTKPYIYQYVPQDKLSLKVRVGDSEETEQGTLYMEATFIS
ncbi:putative cell survival pathways protein [Onygenales sp. PD_40]|nr:putative cell survival pathways protein [Onygenales sp. PD_40]KAK2790444.1 putative cell survival pathways protein [Emmonsiellopsis sp. PD_33]KAK2792718.1 putative cell survival pathways protein [Onygenales sp. PD_12]KAK2799778.1 putative cell survival pathways protein [Onygenales sp. PD_10]